MTALTDATQAAPAEPAEAGTERTMPGWHIVADLTPPEVLTTRRMRVVRLIVIGLLVLVTGGCVLGYLYTQQLASDAADELTGEQQITTSLLEQQRSYAQVTNLHNTIGTLEDQTAMLMESDVDIDALLGEIWEALPPGMTIDQIAITVPSTVAGANARTPSGGASALDTSEAMHIGSVTLNGTGSELSDLSALIDNLATIDGVFAPYPLSNQVAEVGTSYGLQFTLTDARLSHAFDQEGGN